MQTLGELFYKEKLERHYARKQKEEEENACTHFSITKKGSESTTKKGFDSPFCDSTKLQTTQKGSFSGLATQLLKPSEGRLNLSVSKESERSIGQLVKKNPPALGKKAFLKSITKFNQKNISTE